MELAIEFTPGNDGGSPITNYQYSLNGGAYTPFDPPIDPDAMGVTITELQNGTLYTIRLKAVNANGPSTPSDPVSETPG